MFRKEQVANNVRTTRREFLAELVLIGAAAVTATACTRKPTEQQIGRINKPVCPYGGYDLTQGEKTRTDLHLVKVEEALRNYFNPTFRDSSEVSLEGINETDLKFLRNSKILLTTVRVAPISTEIIAPVPVILIATSSFMKEEVNKLTFYLQLKDEKDKGNSIFKDVINRYSSDENIAKTIAGLVFDANQLSWSESVYTHGGRNIVGEAITSQGQHFQIIIGNNYDIYAVIPFSEQVALTK